jgi:GNAT superfamily N-acetyltransferase
MTTLHPTPPEPESAHLPTPGTTPAPTPAATRRWLEPHEGETLTAFYRQLSARSRRLRFLTPVPRLTPALLRPLIELDAERHRVLGAFTDGRLIGVAELARCPGSDLWELAITVADDRQGRGIGRWLLESAAEAAVDLVIGGLYLAVSADNRAMLGLLSSYGVRPTWSYGLGEAVASPAAFLAASRASRPATAERRPRPAVHPRPAWAATARSTPRGDGTTRTADATR